jgi:hypothetical protein
MVAQVTYYTHAQALRMYRSYGVKVPVLLSEPALRKVRAQGKARRAGLAELAVASNPQNVRGTFESQNDFDAWLLQARAEVHALTVQSELQ